MTNSFETPDPVSPARDETAPADVRTAIRQAVEVETLRRAPETAEDAAVTTPRPRLALRVGVTGHRPGRLLESARKLGMSLDEHEKWLSDELARVFAAIEDGVRFAREKHRFGPREQTCFYDDDTPLVRLVAGLALGTDTIAVNCVDARFRGERKPAAGGDFVHLRAPRPSAPPRAPIEWQIDAVLPFPASDFAYDAIEDFALHHRETRGEAISDQQARDDFHAHWRGVLSVPDTTVVMPTTWRPGEAPGKPDPDLADRIGSLRARETREKLARDHGAIARPPDVPAEDRKHLRLDYALAGDFMLRQIDLLVAVWDGEPARGVGGAPDLVATAIDRGLPVVYIDCDDRDAPPRMVCAVERMESRSAVVGWRPMAERPIPELADACVDAIRDAIVGITAPPCGAAVHGHAGKRDNRGRTIDFLEEQWPKTAAPPVYGALQDFARRPGLASAWRFIAACFSEDARVSDAPHPSEQRWTLFINDNPDEGPQAARLKRVLHRRYVIADLLAVRYADLYRAAFIKSYLMSALAVIIAIAGFLLPESDWIMTGKAALVALELWVVWAIRGIVRHGEKHRWHEKFLHYRSLAESLRHLRFLATFAEFAETGGPRLSDENAWWLWYVRATAREIGLPHGALGPNFQRSILSLVKTYELAEQIAYHETTAALESETDHAIHHFGAFLFTATAVILSLTLAAFIWENYKAIAAIGLDHVSLRALPRLLDGRAPWLHDLKPWIGALAAALPTLGAALAGIRFTADFDGKAVRSNAMKRDLHQIAASFDKAIQKQDFTATRAALLEAAAIMAEDVAAFQSLYGRKPLILPG